jgi:hypothetical protein
MDVAMVTNVTMVIELTGISMAASIGDSFACTAKLNPTKLYRIEIIQLASTIRFPAMA